MEKKILLVNAKEIKSKKNSESYYLIEYVDIKAQKNKSKIINVDDWEEKKFNKFKDKVKNGIVEVTGIFEPDEFDRITLDDIK